MHLNLPDQVLQTHSEQEIRLEIAIALFQKEVFTLGLAAEWAGLHKIEFQQELGKRKIPLHIGIDDVKKEWENLRAVFGDRS
jgi:predicted HTH domain antitoxin